MRFDDEKIVFPVRASDPAAPGAGKRRLYALADGLYSIDDTGIISKHSMDLRQPITIFREQMNITVGDTTLVRTVNTSQTFSIYFRRGTGALGDQYELPIPLGKGEYIFTTLAVRSSGGGIETYSLGATTIDTLDHYAASATFNVMQRTLITIDEGGLYTFSAEVTGKNASSSGHFVNTTAHFFNPRVKRGVYGDFV